MPHSPCKNEMNTANGILPTQVMLKTKSIKMKTEAVWPTIIINWLIEWANKISDVWTPVNLFMNKYIIDILGLQQS